MEADNKTNERMEAVIKSMKEKKIETFNLMIKLAKTEENTQETKNVEDFCDGCIKIAEAGQRQGDGIMVAAIGIFFFSFIENERVFYTIAAGMMKTATTQALEQIIMDKLKNI